MELRNPAKREARCDEFSVSSVRDTPARVSLGSRFPLTGFGQALNGKALKASWGIHHRSALVAASTALTSPTLRAVRRQNIAHLARPAGNPATAREALLAQLTPDVLQGILDQVLEHMDDAFLTNVRRHLYKAAGHATRAVRGGDGDDPAERTRTRAELVAEMIALDAPGSALNAALDRLAPTVLAGRPIAGMGRLELDDLQLRIAAETFDCLMQPTPEQARRTAELIVELGAEGQRIFDDIHADALRALQQDLASLPRDVPETLHQEVALRHAATTSRRIDQARKDLFDTFRRRNGGQFGYHSLSEQVRENGNIEYYRSLMLPSAETGFVARIAAAACTTAGGPLGLGLSMAATAIGMYAGAVIAQSSVGGTGAAAADLKHFDSNVMPKAVLDRAVYDNQRDMSAAVKRIGDAALAEYTRPGNPAARDCLRTVQSLERKGYRHAALCQMPELLALWEYQKHMLGGDAGALEDAVPAPIRIAALLHRFEPALPSLVHLAAPDGTIDEATRRTALQHLIEAIDQQSEKKPPADAATIAARAGRHIDSLVERSGIDRQALASLLAPDTAAMHAGGVDFMALVQTLLQTSGAMEPALFQSHGVLSAQYRGLLVNAVVSLAIQMAVGLAAFFGISAASAAGGPGAGFGAAAFFAVLSFALSAFSRDASAVAWYSHDIRSQTNARLYTLMNLDDARPVAHEPGASLEAVEKAVLQNHSPLYGKRMLQLMATLRAHYEKPLILGSQLQRENGFGLLLTLDLQEQSLSGARAVPFASGLAGKSMAAMHLRANVEKHQALLDIHQAGRTLIDTTAEAARLALRTPALAIRAISDDYRKAPGSRGVRESQAYLAKHRAHFKDASGEIPAHVEIDALRARARAAFEAYVERQQQQPGFRFCQGDFKSLATALRTPHSDDATELWLAGMERRLEAAGALVAQPVDIPLFNAPLSSDYVRAWRKSHRRRAAEIEEHQAAMRLIFDDMVGLKTGRFEAIRDPLGIIGASLAHNGMAGQYSREHRKNHDKAMISFVRGTGRFIGQVVPVTLGGAATSALMLASGAVAILQVAGPHWGDFTLGKHSPQDARELAAQGIHLSPFQIHGMSPKLSGLSATWATSAMGVTQPSTGPITFKAHQDMQNYQRGFGSDEPAFTNLIAGSAVHHRLNANSATDDPEILRQADAAGEVMQYLATDIGSTQLKLRIDLHLEAAPEEKHLPHDERARKREAREQSTQAFHTRLGGFKPGPYVHNLKYGLVARKHHGMVEQDRHQMASSLAVAGIRLARQEAPPEDTPAAAALRPEVVSRADRMIRRLLQEPDAVAQVFVGRAPPDAQARQALVLRRAVENPWYLLRLVHFRRGQLDPLHREGDRPALDRLQAFHRALTADIERVALPATEQQLRHAITLCGERPMPPGRWDDLDDLQVRTADDVARMADGPARTRLEGVLDELRADLMAARELNF